MTTQVVTNWKKEWFEIEDATYLNTAARTYGDAARIYLRSRACARSEEVYHHRTARVPATVCHLEALEEREGVRLRVIAPRDRFITADDLIDALAPKTRIVSVSLVRSDDGSLLDAARLATACHAQRALLLLDVSQACGAVANER